jgi:hypothetical protein
MSSPTNKSLWRIHQPKMLLLTELRNRFERIVYVNSDKFSPIPAAACLLNPAVAAVMLIPERAPLLHAAKVMIIRLYEGHGTAMVHSSVSGTTESDDSSTGEANLVKKFSFVVNKIIQSANTTSHSSHSTETVQGQLNRYVSELTESNFNIDNGLEYWQNRLTTKQADCTAGSRLTVCSSISGICGKNLFFVWTSECWMQRSYAEINGNASFLEAKQTCFSREHGELN